MPPAQVADELVVVVPAVGVPVHKEVTETEWETEQLPKV
jgi:hypothetical protein